MIGSQETKSNRRGFAGTTELARGAVETLAIVTCFAITGLAWATIEAHLRALPDAAAVSTYASGVSEDPSASSSTRSEPENGSDRVARVWLVDGFNVLHAGLLGGRDRSHWWTEHNRRELLDRVERFEDADAELWIVFDGSHPDPATDGSTRSRCVFAPSADTWLVDRVRAAAQPARVAVVTADRQVAGRARSRGAKVVSPRAFLARCPV